MTLTQQWWYLNLTRNSFYILLPAKGIMIYKQINSCRLCIRLKGTWTLVNKLNNVNVSCLEIREEHRGPRVWDPCYRKCLSKLKYIDCFSSSSLRYLTNASAEILAKHDIMLGLLMVLWFGLFCFFTFDHDQQKLFISSKEVLSKCRSF